MNINNTILLGFCILTLVACGGGASSNNDSSLTTTPPVVEEPTSPVESDKPNILLIIADDLGLDASNQFSLSDDKPNSPNLDQLAQQGLVFDNVWSTPACTTSRATLITGKYGSNSGVDYVLAMLSNKHQVLQQYLQADPNSADYASAVFGKWHLAGNEQDANHPASVGIDYYAGNLANLTDYYNWPLTINGQTEQSSEYNTSKITDLAADWITTQTSPWFAWVAYSAPHAPFHLPPTDLQSQSLSGTSSDIAANKRAYYLAAIQAMDTEIGRLLASLPDIVRDNTVVIFVGDNGTPAAVIDPQVYATNHAKGSLYQGGVAVPMIISGKGVSRRNQHEDALVTLTDLYATIGQIAGIEQQNVHDSHSFVDLLSASEDSAPLIYTEFKSDEVTGYAVRAADFKLITFDSGQQELYDLSADLAETQNLISANNTEAQQAYTRLTDFSHTIVESNDAIDITNALLSNTQTNCTDYAQRYKSTVLDVNRSIVFSGAFSISVQGDQCVFSTNVIPNHDFNDGNTSFPNSVKAQNAQFSVTTDPLIAELVTPLSLNVNNAILLNGVVVDLLAAGCFGIADGKIGCNNINQAWRYDPMFVTNGFVVDTHNAHAQPDGTYHYHGSPKALFSNEDPQTPSPLVGFAADGFPIFGPYFDDTNTVRKALSSFKLKTGNRPTDNGQPGGTYDGSYRDDYEYVPQHGDLDECNGMLKNGQYAYYITDRYPYILACFKGEPDSSFTK
jgi:arylsulfatase A-like enzyme